MWGNWDLEEPGERWEGKRKGFSLKKRTKLYYALLPNHQDYYR